MPRKTIREITEEEMRKVHNYPRYVFYTFAYPSEISEVRRRLRLSRIPFRTEKVVEGGKLIGWNVFVMR